MYFLNPKSLLQPINFTGCFVSDNCFYHLLWISELLEQSIIHQTTDMCLLDRRVSHQEQVRAVERGDPHMPPSPQRRPCGGTFPDSRDALLTWADTSPGAGVLTRTHRLLGTVGPDPRVTKIAETVSTGNS